MAAWVMVTDIDGTILDSKSYSFAKSRPALARLERAGVPVVLATSKTRAEVEVLRRRLGNAHPFIVESGGEILVPVGYFDKRPSGFSTRGRFWVLPLGRRRAQLRRDLGRLAKRAGVEVRTLSRMTLAEISRRTGLPGSSCRLARRRSYSEPFVITRGDAARLGREARRAGMTLAHGGRFHHLLAGCDKGLAARRLLAVYGDHSPSLKTAAVGDSPNDLPFLKEADLAFAVEGPRGGWHPGLPRKGLRRLRGRGPAGFRRAVAEVLRRCP